MLRLYASSLFYGMSIIGKVFRFIVSIVMPIAISVVCYRLQWTMNANLPTIIISVFSIFSAMLFSSQVAAFSVFNHKMLEVIPEHSEDDIIKETNLNNSARRVNELRGAFRMINAGISMLTLLALSITALTLLFVASVPVISNKLLTAGISLLVAHFLVSFVMTCFHVFALFDSAYLGEGKA